MDDILDIAEQFYSDSGIHIPPVYQSTPTSQCFNKTAPLSLQQTHDKRKGHQNSSRCKAEPSKEDKECTFAPKINMYRNRNIGEFLDLQRGFVERKEMKLARIKEQLNYKESIQFTGRPSIDSRSKRIAQRIAGEPVFQRLSRERERSESAQCEEKFKPRILGKSKSLSRSDPVGELLYSDAQRRIEKEKITARQSAKMQCTAPRINVNTDRLVTRGIRQEFDSFVGQNESVTPVVALTIISQLFNVDLNPKKDQQTEVICEKVLGYVNSKQQVRIDRLWHFIEGILGKVDDQSKYFTQQQQIDIYKIFGYFYRQRLTKVPKPVQEQPPSFQPQILRNSERLAAKKREKMLHEANNLLNHQNVGLSVDDTKQIALADLYILERMNKQQKHAQQRIDNQEKTLKECTFKPVINRNSLGTPSNKQNPSKKTTVISSKYLSTKFKLKTQNNENTFATLNTQYSCDKEHRNSVKHSTSKEAKIHEIRDIEKTVLRLSAARKDREYHNLIRERGYPKDVDNWESYRVNEKRAIDHAHKELKGYCGEKKKAFVFDVHVGGGVIETIQVATGQSLSQLVDVVAAKHDFDENKRSKLLEMMKYHLRLHTKGQDKENNNRVQPVSNE